MQNIDPIYESLLIRRLTGEVLSSKESSDLGQWLASDAAHQQYADEMSWIFTTSEQKVPEVDVDAAFSAVEKRMEAKVISMTEKASQNTSKKSRSKVKYLIQVAAVAAVLIAIFYTVWTSPPTPQWQEVARTESIQTFNLKDGSNIRMAENTLLEVDQKYGNDFRAVRLTGKAFFDVKRNEEKPFVVYSNDAVVKVLGTSFSVEEASEDRILVKVKSGLVQVFHQQQSLTDPDQFILLKKGESGYVSLKDGSVTKLEETINPREFSWANRRINFHNSTIEEVITRIKKEYGVQIELETPGMKYCRISVGVRASSVEETLDSLVEIFDWKYQKNENGFILQGESCQP